MLFITLLARLKPNDLLWKLNKEDVFNKIIITQVRRVYHLTTDCGVQLCTLNIPVTKKSVSCWLPAGNNGRLFGYSVQIKATPPQEYLRCQDVCWLELGLLEWVKNDVKRIYFKQDATYFVQSHDFQIIMWITPPFWGKYFCIFRHSVFKNYGHNNHSYSKDLRERKQYGERVINSIDKATTSFGFVQFTYSFYSFRGLRNSLSHIFLISLLNFKW
jgi:hypothetical protein